MKKIISLLLSFVMLFTLLTPALAASNDMSLATTNQEQITIPLQNGGRMEIISSSNKNTRSLNDCNSFLIKEYVNNELTHTVQGTVGGDQLICTDYEDGLMTNQKIIYIADRVTVDNSTAANTAASSSYGSVLGHIVYNKDIGNTVPGEKITVYSKVTKQDSESYIINGDLADTLSDIAGILVSVLCVFISTEITITKIAIAIVSYYGGNVAGGAIGVIFTEKVAVDATHYTLTGYHAASNYYTPGYDGVERLVKTKNSSAYNNWFYSGFTPHTWKDGDDLASNLWTAVFARTFPYVYQYQ